MANPQHAEKRSTFDNYKSDPKELKIGLDQGRPESGPIFAFYNAALADIVGDKKKEEVVIFADDTTLRGQQLGYHTQLCVRDGKVCTCGLHTQTRKRPERPKKDSPQVFRYNAG